MKSFCYQLNIDRIKAIIENIFKAAKHLEALYENNASARLIDILLSFKDCNGILPFLHAGRIMKENHFEVQPRNTFCWRLKLRKQSELNFFVMQLFALAVIFRFALIP